MTDNLTFIKTLVRIKKMKNKIENLISKLLDDSLVPGESLPVGTSYDSSKTLAFQASKEIQKLDRTSISTVKEILLKEKNKERKSKAYSILRILAEKHNEVELIYFILDNLNLEKTKNIISLHLGGLAWTKLELTERLDIVLDFAKRKEWQIRHSAIQLLAHYSVRVSEIENLLINILKNSKDEYDLTYTNSTLRLVGINKSIEFLKTVIRENKKTDVLITGINALSEIDGKNQVDFFMEMMNDKKDSFVKSTLTKHITKFSDQRAIELLIDRVKKILAKKRNTNMHYGSDQSPEIVYAIDFLKKYELEDERIPKLLQWIVNKKLDFFDETELRWVKENIKKAGNTV